MIEVSFTYEDTSATAEIPDNSPLAMFYKYSNIAEDPDIITILNFINKSVSINDIKNKKDFIEKILYYGAVDLETRIDDMMNNRKLPNGAIYGQQVFVDLFEKPNYRYYYHMTMLDIYDHVINHQNFPKDITICKDYVEIDSNYIFTRDTRKIFYHLTSSDCICISDSNIYDIYSNSVKIGKYYLYISENFKQGEYYSRGYIDTDYSNSFNMVDKIHDGQLNLIDDDFKIYEVHALMNINCSSNALHYYLRKPYNCDEIYTLKMMLQPTPKLLEIYKDYY